MMGSGVRVTYAAPLLTYSPSPPLGRSSLKLRAAVGLANLKVLARRLFSLASARSILAEAAGGRWPCEPEGSRSGGV
ncbi:hypothetical protein OCEANICA350_12290 [Oceanicaulis sp. 350]|nr:hypothetical protein OCEANICA350_12290 [Oceanicaulis sp. 350]